MSETFTVNSTISHYRILEKLGAGGMGEVFLAEDTRLNRRVALKVLPENIASDKERLRRFEQEARAASGLNHPNILTVYEFGEDGRVHFLATELVEGVTLREKINRSKMPLAEALDIAEQVAFALSAAHRAGIIHRDIKPENIMVRPDGIVKVLDFGIAKLASPPTGDVDAEGETLAKVITQTKSGRITGTLNYMSPEQVRGQSLDGRSDIFSLGVCLYEMLAGKMPFDKPTTSDVIAAILTETPPPVTDSRTDAPPELERIASKALEKNKDERYQNCKDFLLDIKTLKREIEFPANPEGAATARRTNKVKKRLTMPDFPARPLSLAYALAAFLIAILVIGGIWWLSGKNNSEPETNLSFSPSTTEVANWRSSPGEVYSSGSFSPDGKLVAFASTKSGAKNIWVKQLSGGEAIQVTKDEFGNQNPIWSPGGDEIAFFSTRSGAPGIWRVSALGGNPTFVKNVKDGSMILRRWSKKGVIYYEAEQNLFAIDLKSGELSQLTKLDANKVNPNTISISPDEEQIAYTTFENEQYGVWTAPLLRGGLPKQIASLSGEVRNAVWHPDGRRILYSAMTGGIFQIFAVAAGGKPTQITYGEKDAFVLGASEDGAKILYSSSKEESDLWAANVEKGEEFPVASDINSELWANASPDGKSVAYQSIKNLSQGDKIFYGAIQTKPAQADAQPFQLVANGFLPTWSPDGKQLAFMRVTGEAYNLWTVKASGGEERQLTTEGLPSVEFTVLPYNRTQASYFSWSPDSRRIAYVSKSDGRSNIWLAQADASGKTQLTENADSILLFYCPLWSADGAFLAYSTKLDHTRAGGKRFYGASVINTQTKNSKPIAQSENFQRLLGWSQSGKELLLAAVSTKNGTGLPAEVAIIQVDVETGEQRHLAKLEAAYLYNIYLSADKKMLAYVSKKDDKDNIWVMRASAGGAAEARKITSNTDPKLYFSSMAWSPDNRTIYFGKQTRYSLLSMVTNFK